MILDNSASYVLGYIAAWVWLLATGLLSVWLLKGRGGRYAGNLNALFLGVMAFLLIMEGFFGFFYDQPDAFGVLNTSKRWFKRHYRHNNLGFRDDKEYSLEKAQGRKKIVFIGDSFTAGHGISRIEDRFPNIVEKRLKEVSADIEVYTMAVNGWDTIDQVEFLKDAVQKGLDADLIVLCFNMNDIGRTSLETNLDTYLFYRVIEERLSQNWLLRNSYSVNFFYGRAILPSVPEVAGNAVERRATSYEGAEWEKVRGLLREFMLLCSRQGYELKVAILPLIGDLTRGFGMEAAHKKVGDFFGENGIASVDLSKKLKGFRMKDLVVNRFDSHPNEFAHKLIAEEIWEKLIRDEVQGGSE